MPTDFDLLRSLEDEPRTPSTVDVRRAIADGRRRRRLRRGIGYTSAAAVTALAVTGASFAASGLSTKTPQNAAATGGAAASSAPKGQYTIPGTPGWKAPVATAPTTCSLIQLPTPDNVPMALVSSGDPTGHYFVGRSYPKGGYQAVIWHDDKAEKVLLPGDDEESLTDVNSSGVAVGWSFQGHTEEDTVQVPYVYRDGQVSKLPGVKRGEARAINEAGAIVGTDDSDALVWPSATAKPIRLPVAAGSMQSASTGKTGARPQVTAVVIDEDGTVVGNIGTSRPYVWFADGTHRELPLPTLDGKPAASGRVFGIRNGWAFGVADSVSGGAGDPKAAGAAAKARGQLQAVLWNVHTGEVNAVDDFQTGADAVNAQGWQVGINKQGRAALVTGTAAQVVLPELANHEPLSTIANTISDDGRTIGGQSDDANGTIRAVVWRCQ